MAQIVTTKIGECEVCPKTEVKITVHYGNMWFCDECWESETKRSAEHMSPEKQQERLNAYLERSRKIDNKAEVKTDLFNASTVAFVELQAAIEQDAAIANKRYALCEEVTRRIEKIDSLIFGHREELLKLENERRMYQVNLQNQAAQLRNEEREKLNIKGLINYNPATPKTTKPAAPKKSKKLDMDAIKRYAAQYGVPAAAIQMLVTAKKSLTYEQAAKQLSEGQKKATA